MDIKPPSRPKQPIDGFARPKPVQKPVAQPTQPVLPPMEAKASSTPNPKKPRKRSIFWGILRRHLRLSIVLLVAVVIIATAVGIVIYYQQGLQPVGGSEKRIRVTVETGSTSDQIAKQLTDAHVIRCRICFSTYVSLKDDKNKLQAGNYAFSPQQSTPEIVQNLVEGKVDTFNVTILPGETLKDIKVDLLKYDFSSDEIDKAFAATYDGPIFADKPSGASLEGYIYPDTYQIDSSTSVKQLLQRAFDEFAQQMQAQGIVAGFAQQGLSFQQGLTLASIVELEAKNPDDQAKIAQVFLKRLRSDIPLGSDVTYMYAAKLLGVTASPNLDSPYNTRINKGLPPTPIANVTIAVLERVMHPAATDYLYFVAGDDGTVHYATTEQEHEDNIKKYCTRLCQ